MARGQRQLALRFRRRGGARAGAGRPPRGERAGVAHLRRAAHARQHPLHVTLRVQHGLRSLREPALFARVRRAMAAGRSRFGFALVHFSVQRDHLHLIAEAEDQRALARGVQGLTIRVARAVNAQLRRKGRVFADRYHARALKSPRAVRWAVRYVLMNVRKHTARTETKLAVGFVDPCSSSAWFAGFARPEGLAFGAHAVRSEWAAANGPAPPVEAARCWLLRVGYQRAGPIDVDDVPGTACCG